MFLNSLGGFLLYHPVLVSKDTAIAETFVIATVVGFSQRSIKYRYVETCPMWVRGTLVGTKRRKPFTLQAQKEPKATHKRVELPQNAERDLVSSQYPTFAQEGAYALAGSVVKHAVLPNAPSLRHLEFEGTPFTSLFRFVCMPYSLKVR